MYAWSIATSLDEYIYIHIIYIYMDIYIYIYIDIGAKRRGPKTEAPEAWQLNDKVRSYIEKSIV